MKIKVKVSPDTLDQIWEDMLCFTESGFAGKDLLSPLTVDFLKDVIGKVTRRVAKKQEKWQLYGEAIGEAASAIDHENEKEKTNDDATECI